MALPTPRLDGGWQVRQELIERHRRQEVMALGDGESKLGRSLHIGVGLETLGHNDVRDCLSETYQGECH